MMGAFIKPRSPDACVHLLPLLRAGAVEGVPRRRLSLHRPLPLPGDQHLHDLLSLHDRRRRGQQVRREEEELPLSRRS